jgi:hypothetical protein
MDSRRFINAPFGIKADLRMMPNKSNCSNVLSCPRAAQDTPIFREIIVGGNGHFIGGLIIAMPVLMTALHIEKGINDGSTITESA